MVELLLWVPHLLLRTQDDQAHLFRPRGFWIDQGSGRPALKRKMRCYIRPHALLTAILLSTFLYFSPPSLSVVQQG